MTLGCKPTNLGQPGFGWKGACIGAQGIGQSGAPRAIGYSRASVDRNLIFKPKLYKEALGVGSPNKSQQKTQDFNRNPRTLNGTRVVLSQRTDRTPRSPTPILGRHIGVTCLWCCSPCFPGQLQLRFPQGATE